MAHDLDMISKTLTDNCVDLRRQKKNKMIQKISHNLSDYWERIKTKSTFLGIGDTVCS